VKTDADETEFVLRAFEFGEAFGPVAGLDDPDRGRKPRGVAVAIRRDGVVLGARVGDAARARNRGPE